MKIRKVFFAALAGLITGFCIEAGNCLDVNYTLDLMQPGFYIKWLFCSLLSGVLAFGLWSLADGTIIFPEKLTSFIKKATEKVEKFDRHFGFWSVLVILFLMWVPTWLSIFPGVFSYDAYDEWMQVKEGVLTAHHPVLHVLFLGGITEGIYQLTGNYNAGIALCTGIQMLLLAATFSYTLVFMKERGANPYLRIFALLFYGLSPVVRLFAICGTKDTLFFAAMLIFMISIYRIVFCRETFFVSKGHIALFIVSGLLTMILRNNGLYIVLLMLPILGFVCRKYWKKYALTCGIILAAYVFYIGPLYGMLGVSQGGKQEMLSVPLQQMARVYKFEKEVYSQEDLEYLHALIPEENWKAYRSTVSDFVKSGFQEEVFDESPLKFAKVWVKTGLKCPLTYVNSFLIGTVDFWYPFAVVDGYQAENSSWFDYKVSEPGRERVIFPRLHGIYEYISHEHEAQKIWGSFLVLSPGWYFLIFVMTFLYFWKNKKYGRMLVLFPVLFNMATVFLGPIALVRYVLILFYAFPLYGILLKEPKEKKA